MSTVHSMDGKITVIVKGAFDVLASKCISGDIERAREFNDRFSRDALRVIALAFKEIGQSTGKSNRRFGIRPYPYGAGRHN